MAVETGPLSPSEIPINVVPFRREAALVEESPEELLKKQRSNWGRLGALVRNRIITWENINPLNGEINYSSLGTDFAEDGKYKDFVKFLRGRNYQFSEEKKLRQKALEEWDKANQAAKVIEILEEIDEVKTAGSHLEIDVSVAVVDTVEEWRREGRCYPSRQASRMTSSLKEVTEMGIRLRKDSLHQNGHQGGNRFWQNLKESFDPVTRRIVRKAIPYALLLAVGATAYTAIASGELDRALNPARPMANDETTHLMVSEPLPAPVLDVVLPAVVAGPINPEPLAKVEPPAEVLKEVIVDGSIAQTLLNEGVPIHWQPGHPLFEITIDRFEQIGDDNFPKLREFNRNMGGSYFPASKAEFHILANQARKDPDARKLFYGLFDHYGADSTLVVRFPTQNNNSVSSSETSN